MKKFITYNNTKIYSIYKITNNINGKMYIGYTSYNPDYRYKLHQLASKRLTNSKQHIHNALDKYGMDNFEFEVIFQSLHEKFCLNMESYFINQFNTFNSDIGYNHTSGGEDRKRSKSTIEKHRQKIKGRPQSEEHKKKKALSIMGDKNGMFGVKQGENKMRRLLELSKVAHKEYRKQFKYYYIDVYGNISEANSKYELESVFELNFNIIQSKFKRNKFHNNIMYVGCWKTLVD